MTFVGLCILLGGMHIAAAICDASPTCTRVDSRYYSGICVMLWVTTLGYLFVGGVS